MKQEVIAGIIFCVMGAAMLVLPPKTLWKIAEKWKTKGSGQPSDKYVLIARILGVVFAAVGGWLLVSGL